MTSRDENKHDENKWWQNPDNLVIGDQIFYPPKNNLLMEVIAYKGPLNKREVTLVDVEEYERNNRVAEGMNLLNLPMPIANTFLRRRK